jgi:hypothetical protein
LLVGDVGHFAERSGRGYGNAQHRRGVRVELFNDWTLSRFRQIVDDEIDLVADFLSGDVGILFEDKVDEDLGNAFD